MKSAVKQSLFITSILVSVLSISFVFGSEDSSRDLCNEEMATKVGGITDSHGGAENSVEVENLARFAVDEHNKKENAILKFARVVKAKEQVVAGTMHHLTIEAIEAGKKKLYEAKVWVKPWLNFKELHEFKHAGDCPSPFTSSDLGAKRGEPVDGWKDVAVHDPHVQDAAKEAVKTIQQRSNSLSPYELKEVVHAKVEQVEDSAKFHLLLKVKRGDKEEKYKVEVHQNNEDCKSGKCIQVIDPLKDGKSKGTSSFISCLALDASESWLACGSGRDFSVWNLHASECISKTSTRTSIQDLQFDANQILAVGAEAVLRRFDLDGATLSEMQCAPQSAFSVSLDPAGVVAVAGYEGLVDVISQFGSHLCTFRCICN